MIEITKACRGAFMKARNSLILQCREKKKNRDGENVFFKALANRFCLTSKSFLWFMTNLLSNGLHEKIMICY